MRTIVICVLIFAASMAVAAPVVHVIEDFEGEEPALTDDATVIQLDGRNVLRWAPERDQPWFLSFRYSDIEMVQWDRLEFRYRIDGAARVDWWGVKVVDFPLGDGYQVPYRVHPDDLVLGEWATASLPIHPAPRRWGDSPDETAQSITFRASGVSGDSPVFLIDDIRVVREALHLDIDPTAPPRRDGERWRRDFNVSLRSVAEQPMHVSIESHLQPDVATVELPEARELAPGEIWEDTLSIAVPITLEALTYVNVTLAAITHDDYQVEEDAVMAVPLPEIEHPVLMVRRDDLPRIRERIERFDWARETWQRLQRNAEAWVDREIEIPDRGGQWYHWYSCDDCGSRLTTVSPTEHLCETCDARYTGWPYDDVVIMRRHNDLSNAVRTLGLAYAIGEDERYAAKAREIILGYSEAYLNYPLENRHGEEGPGACHVASQPLTEATWLIPIVQGFDCIYDTFSEDERATIAEKLLLPAAELIRSYSRSIHNIPCWLNAAYGMVGITLGEADLAAQAINGEFGFRNQIAEGVNDDGMWYEGAWGYHYYTMSALEPLAVAAENVGIDLYCDRYLSMFTTPVRMMGPNGDLPAFNDSGRTTALGRHSLYENAAARWDTPELGVVLAGSERRSNQALLLGPDELPSGTTELSSTIFPAAGIAVLRSRVDEPIDTAVAGAPANYLALGYGPHGGGHGHPDKLGFEMYVLGRLTATDAGMVQYGNPAHHGWYKQTLSHNTVVVDGVSQQPTEGELLYHTFGENGALVGAQTEGAYPGVILRRIMALLPDGLLDITVALSDEERQYDWAYHSRGEFVSEHSFAGLSEPPGEGAYEWAEDWRSAGLVDDFAADWIIDGELTVQMAQATAPTCEMFAAIGRGTPATARDPFIMSRIEAPDAAWGTVAWWGGGEGPQARLLRGTRNDVELGPDQAIGLEVMVGRRRALLLTADGGATFGEIVLDGSAALIEFEDGNLVQCLAAEATRVTVGDNQLH